MDDLVYGDWTCTSFGNFMVADLANQPGNASLTDQADLDLAELCDQIAGDELVRVVVLGFDGNIRAASRMKSDQYGRMDRCSFVDPVSKLKQPVIAAIRGDAVGLGLELALACDIRIATEDARFGLPQIRDGQMPSDGGTQRLPRLIGQGKAMQMILTGEMINSLEACRCGLINRIASAQTLMDETLTLAREMAEKSPLSLSYVKEALHKGLDLTLDQGIGMELDLYLLLFTTSDRNEGINAFREKRKPEFEGV